MKWKEFIDKTASSEELKLLDKAITDIRMRKISVDGLRMLTMLTIGKLKFLSENPMTEDQLNEIRALRKEVIELRNEVSRWRTLYLDKPEDRLYHASDKTWWKRDDSTEWGVGHLVAADPPEEFRPSMEFVITGPTYYEDDQECGYCNRPIGKRHELWCRQ